MRLLLLTLLLPLIVQSAESGVYIRLNRKSIDYFTELASEALPELLENITLPTIKPSNYVKLTPTIQLFTRPKISTKLLQSNGVRAELIIDKVVVSAYTQANVVFFEYKETVLVTVENINAVVQLHFDRNTTTNTNLITAEECTVIDPTISLVFPDPSDLISFNDTFATNIVSALRDAVCETAVNALTYIDEQHVQQNDDQDDGMSAGEFASDLCAAEEVIVTPSPPGGLTSPIQSGPPWSVDLTLTQLPKFTEEDVTFGVNGGVLLATMEATSVPSPLPLNPELLGKRMVGVIVTDYVPNTFFSHVFDYGIGEVEYKIHPETLPSSLRSIARLLCGQCHLQVSGSLISKPRVEIDAELGARVLLAANVSVVLHGRKTDYDVINATTHMYLTLRPVIRNSHVYGDVALTSVDFDITNLGVGGALSGPLEKFMSFIVPRTMWPAIRKRIRFALHQRGVKLPVLCGVSMNNLDLSYTDRAAVIKSDFHFDLPLFIRKFKTYMNRKMTEAGGKPLYV